MSNDKILEDIETCLSYLSDFPDFFGEKEKQYENAVCALENLQKLLESDLNDDAYDDRIDIEIDVLRGN